MELISEGARFITARLQTDWEMKKALLASKTPQDLMQMHAKFLNTAVTQYAEQVALMQQMTLRNLTDVSEDFRKGRSRGYDDVPV